MVAREEIGGVRAAPLPSVGGVGGVGVGGAVADEREAGGVDAVGVEPRGAFEGEVGSHSGGDADGEVGGVRAEAEGGLGAAAAHHAHLRGAVREHQVVHDDGKDHGVDGGGGGAASRRVEDDVGTASRLRRGGARRARVAAARRRRKRRETRGDARRRDVRHLDEDSARAQVTDQRGGGRVLPGRVGASRRLLNR